MPALAQARQMVQTIRSSSNPEAMISQMAANNPQLRSIIQNYGGDAKTAFYKYAEANGINPNDILSLIK